MTRFTKQAERGYAGLAAEAVGSALADAGLAPQDVDAAFCGSVAGGPGIGQRVLKDLALAGVPIVNVENACASGSTALLEACAWVRAGMAECALALGVEILSPVDGPLEVPDPCWVLKTGLHLPGWYALKARRHMSDHGTTPRELAAVCVKSRRWAAANPRAHFRSETSVEEVLGSPMVADPLTLFQCCPKTDGAAAAIVCSPGIARRADTRPAWIRGIACVSGTHVFTDAPAGDDAARRAARRAFGAAAVAPEDLDVVECHDAFTIGEVLGTESLGLCADGGGAALAASGATAPGGRGPAVNPSGGLLSRGHPLGASGIAQVCEVVWQLRGTTGPRQVEGARIGAVQTLGASEFELDANAACVTVLEAA